MTRKTINDCGATQAEDDKIIATSCSCDFSMGTRGMDRCSKCDGTGSRLRVGELYWPNTRDGYIEALNTVRKQSHDPSI
jgi:hypothetical protein